MRNTIVLFFGYDNNRNMNLLTDGNDVCIRFQVKLLTTLGRTKCDNKPVSLLVSINGNEAGYVQLNLEDEV